MMISAGQIKAARAILGWSQDEMAGKAGLSPTTICNLERARNLDKCQITLRSVIEVRRTFARHGLEFIDGEGVRRRTEDVTIYTRPDSCDRFFDDILRTAEDHDGEIVAVARSQHLLCQALGAEGAGQPERLRELAAAAPIKCLLSESSSVPFMIDACQFRISPKYHVGAASYLVCGDRYAIILAEGRGLAKFVVFKSAFMAQAARHDFLPLWDAAAPFGMHPL
jgi:DNA-binding XRE family transcriptional regulator